MNETIELMNVNVPEDGRYVRRAFKKWTDYDAEEQKWMQQCETTVTTTAQKSKSILKRWTTEQEKADTKKADAWLKAHDPQFNRKGANYR